MVTAEDVADVLSSAEILAQHRIPLLGSALLAAASFQPIRRGWSSSESLNDSNIVAQRALKLCGNGEHAEYLTIDIEGLDDGYADILAAASETLRSKLSESDIRKTASGLLSKIWQRYLRSLIDIRESGAVFTPDHITHFAADTVIPRNGNVKVLDPACGTGGFLAAALNKNDSVQTAGFEKNTEIAALAAVTMALNGKPGNKIRTGCGLAGSYEMESEADYVLMNPPFALAGEPEHLFLDAGLRCLKTGGVLFAVVPSSLICSARNTRGEISWRQQMLKNHALLAVLKLPQDIFYPHASKGTYAAIIRAHEPHGSRPAVFRILEDGISRTKTSYHEASESNMQRLAECLRGWIADSKKFAASPDMEIASLNENIPEICDLSPEHNMGTNITEGYANIAAVKTSTEEGKNSIAACSASPVFVSQGKMLPVKDFFENYERGGSGLRKHMKPGDVPFVTTSETRNGISDFISETSAEKIYPAGCLTISANGGACAAFYHPYRFAASSDVHVISLKREYSSEKTAEFLCAAVNRESWRFNYFRKFSAKHLESLKVLIPVDTHGKPHLKFLETQKEW